LRKTLKLRAEHRQIAVGPVSVVIKHPAAEVDAAAPKVFELADARVSANANAEPSARQKIR
jgi:hypothetical protein